MCANSKFLNETLRNTWGFDGYVTSDCDAVGDVYSPGQRRFPFGSEAFFQLGNPKATFGYQSEMVKLWSFCGL